MLPAKDLRRQEALHETASCVFMGTDGRVHVSASSLSLRLVIKLLDSKASETCSFLPSCKHPADVQIRGTGGEEDLYDRLRITALMTNTGLKYADHM